MDGVDTVDTVDTVDLGDGVAGNHAAGRAGNESVRTRMGMAPPQGACSAGKRSRSATPPTTGGARGHGWEWPQRNHSDQTLDVLAVHLSRGVWQESGKPGC